MDNLQKKFIEEATDNINDLEEALLSLEKQTGDKELIERIFRALHTLKGTGAMFGFNHISELTHDLENIYDLIREGKKEITENIISITLQSADHLRNLLADQKLEIQDNIELQSQLIIKIKKIENESLEKELTLIHTKEREESLANFKSYYIYFQPNPTLLKNGNNPLYLIDELNTLGEIIVYPHFQIVPEIDFIDPEICYIYWEIILATPKNVSDISDVFIFVDDECALEIQFLNDGNIFKTENVKDKLEKLKTQEQESYLLQIQNIIKKSIKFSPKSHGKDDVQKANLISSIRVASEKLDSLMNLVSELVTTQARLTLYAENEGKTELTTIAENVQKLSRQLRDIAFDIVLIPIETVITRFQRLVRDLSSELKKRVIFTSKGTDTELDKTIIESLTDPLLHIIRNCIDHGIEKPEERIKKGKPEEGNILFNAYYSGTNVVIEISDDGAGIDTDKIKNKAIKNGLISEDQIISASEIYDLLFLPGFSTATKVTDVSGRGVGMDVVKRKIAEIRGEVKLDSETDKGTTLTITLPLTLSIIDGLLVRISDIHYIIPLTAVNKIFAVSHDDIKSAFNNHIKLDENLYPFFNLRKEFEMQDIAQKNEQVILIQYQEKQVGIVVDHVVGEYQAVLKPLGKHYKEQEMISGATILGDGTVALVLDTNKLINTISTQILKLEEI